MGLIYNLLRGICLFIYGMKNEKTRKFISERINQTVNIGSCEKIMVQASSVGEINLSEPLIIKLLRETDYGVLISVMTDTGFETAVKKYEKYNGRVSIIKFPLDSKKILWEIFSEGNIKELIIVETEIWPNLIDIAGKYAKIIVVNGRISEKTKNIYRRFSVFFSKYLKKITEISVQTIEDKKRYIEAGADIKKIVVSGNIKYDINYDVFDAQAEKVIFSKTINISGKNIFAAGSTHENEEEMIADVLKEEIKNQKLLLVIAPRHIDRAPVIIDKLRVNGFKVSAWDNPEYDSEIVIINKIGLLRKFYSFADYVFVGGTLIKHGGHSLIEPLFYGKTPIFGKYNHNVKDIADDILSKKIGYMIENAKEIPDVLGQIDNHGAKEPVIRELFNENKRALENSFKLCIDNI